MPFEAQLFIKALNGCRFFISIHVRLFDTKISELAVTNSVINNLDNFFLILVELDDMVFVFESMCTHVLHFLLKVTQPYNQKYLRKSKFT